MRGAAHDFGCQRAIVGLFCVSVQNGLLISSAAYLWAIACQVKNVNRSCQSGCPVIYVVPATGSNRQELASLGGMLVPPSNSRFGRINGDSSTRDEGGMLGHGSRGQHPDTCQTVKPLWICD